MTRASWNCDELSAMALARSSRSTSSTVIAWYEGPEMAQQQPVANESARIIQTFTTPAKTNADRTSADSPAHACVKMSRRLRSTVSAMTPPTRVKSRPGTVAMKLSAPSHVPDRVN